MKSAVRSVVAALFALTSLGAGAAVQSGEMVPEPSVSIAWVGLFLLLFIGVCAFIGVAIYRAEGKKKDDGKRS